MLQISALLAENRRCPPAPIVAVSAATMYNLIVMSKMNNIDPQAWPADVLDRIAGHPAHRIDELLPCIWQPRNATIRQAA
jgi:transposase